MFLKNLRIQNFRCLQDVKLDFEQEDGSIRPRTLIIGENGTGKSSLLKAIGLVTAGSDALGELLGPPEQWIHNNAHFCAIDATLVTAKGEERPIGLRLERDDTLRHVMKRCSESLELLDDALKHTERSYFVAAYGSSRKLEGKRLSRSSGGFYDSLRSSSMATLFNRNATLNPLESWAMELDYLERPDAIDIIETTINRFLPGISFSGINKEEGQLIFKTPDGTVPLEQLSDGYQNMTAWVGDLLYRISESFKDYKDPLSARGLLLVDEIDLHLHPKWQQELLHFIRKTLNSFQFIATTHSPTTVQQADEGEVFFLQRKGKKVTLEAFMGTPNELLLHQIITSEVFNMESDESLKVQQLKTRYEKLIAKSRRTRKEDAELENIRQDLNDLPKNAMSNSLLTSDDRSMLQKLQETLSKRDS